MTLRFGRAALGITVSALAIAQPAAAEIVHLQLTGTFTIGDRRGEDFMVELRYDTEAPATDFAGTTTIFRNAGDIFRFTIGDRRDLLQRMAVAAVPNYVSTVYDLAPPRGVIEQTPSGTRVSFTDPAGTQGGVSFFYNPTPGLTNVIRLPTFNELALFTGGEATFGNSVGTFTYARYAGAVPEPATWGMMILGFGAIGGAMRIARRRSSVSYA